MLVRATSRCSTLVSPLARSFSAGPNFEMSDEQSAIKDLARSFVKDQVVPAAAEYDRSMKFPQPLFKQAWELGLVNIHVGEEAGGLGLHTTEGVIVAEEMAYGCSGFGTAIEANTLASMPVILGGSEEQRKKYVPQSYQPPSLSPTPPLHPLTPHPFPGTWAGSLRRPSSARTACPSLELVLTWLRFRLARRRRATTT